MEAFNLRAAIEHHRKKPDIAAEALSDMPPRTEQELDPVTLHNQVCQTCLRRYLSVANSKADEALCALFWYG